MTSGTTCWPSASRVGSVSRVGARAAHSGLSHVSVSDREVRLVLGSSKPHIAALPQRIASEGNVGLFEDLQLLLRLADPYPSLEEANVAFGRYPLWQGGECAGSALAQTQAGPHGRTPIHGIGRCGPASYP